MPQPAGARRTPVGHLKIWRDFKDGATRCDRAALRLRFQFQKRSRGPPARPRGPGTSLAPRARGGAAPGARAAAAEPAARSLGTY